MKQQSALEALREYAVELGKIVTEIKDTPDRMKVWDFGHKIDFLLNDLEAALTSAPAKPTLCSLPNPDGWGNCDLPQGHGGDCGYWGEGVPIMWAGPTAAPAEPVCERCDHVHDVWQDGRWFCKSCACPRTRQPADSLQA